MCVPCAMKGETQTTFQRGKGFLSEDEREKVCLMITTWHGSIWCCTVYYIFTVVRVESSSLYVAWAWPLEIIHPLLATVIGLGIAHDLGQQESLRHIVQTYTAGLLRLPFPTSFLLPSIIPSFLPSIPGLSLFLSQWWILKLKHCTSHTNTVVLSWTSSSHRPSFDQWEQLFLV